MAVGSSSDDVPPYHGLRVDATAAEIDARADAAFEATRDQDEWEIEGYTIEQLIGAGGVGKVLRARDSSDRVVALKLLSNQTPRMRRFLQREAHILRSLDHPAVVRYLDHGDVDGNPYLVMEWLDGAPLRSLLDERRLSVAETLVLGIRLSSALARIHQHGIVHRDVKPSNVVLPENTLAHATLIDFGVAHIEGTEHERAIVGTPAYMSPEQVRGSSVATPASDVYSLGCVLYECLVGNTPFPGQHPVAVLCKTLFEDVPSVHDVAPHVPAVMDELIQSFLHKDPNARPENGTEAARALETVRATLQAGYRAHSNWRAQRTDALTGDEQRLVNVVIMADTPAMIDHASSEHTLWHPLEQDRFLAAALRSGAHFESLRDGTLIAVLDSSGIATDQASAAARLALSWNSLHPNIPMGLATGRAVIGGNGLVGEVIDRAIELISEGWDRSPKTRESSARISIRIDPLSVALLDDRFDIRAVMGGSVLCAESSVHGARTTGETGAPFVGRHSELSLLADVLEQCIIESRARVIVATSEPGLGKTRLFKEFITRAQDDYPAIDVYVAVGDPMLQSPLSGIVAVLREMIGIRSGEKATERKRKLQAFLTRHELDDERVKVFIGDLLEAPLVPLDHIALRASRKDPLVMTEHLRKACKQLLLAVSTRRPVVIAFDDLQWIDGASMHLMNKLLDDIRELPVLVVGLGRREISDTMDDLWNRHDRVRLSMRALDDDAARTLACSILACGRGDPRLRRILDHARGNPFYLHKLMHTHLRDQRVFPATVLAVVQERISALDRTARRLLRAASVFGATFWRGGVIALLGIEQETDEWLDYLGRDGLIVAQGASRFPGEVQYGFCHALIREGAYAMLTDADRRLAHRLTAEWLRVHGESNPGVLAEHYQRGGKFGEAVPFFLRAAEDAVETGDLVTALELAERGIECGAEGHILGMLHVVRMEVYRWKGDNYESAETCAQALDLLPRGSRHWFEVAGEAAAPWGRIDHWSRVESLARYLCEGRRPGDDRVGWLIASAQVSSQLIIGMPSGSGFELLERAEAEAGDIERWPPLAAANLHLAQATRILVSKPGPGDMLEVLEQCAHSFERAGDLRQACLHRSNVGYAKMCIGLFEEAVLDLRNVLAIAEPLALERAAYSARNNLGMALAYCGDITEALAIEESAMRWFESQGENRLMAGSLIYTAKIYLLAGDAVAAERAARTAVSCLPDNASLGPQALSLVAEASMAQQRLGDARDAVDMAVSRLTSLGTVEEGEPHIRLIQARVLYEIGERDAARSVIAQAAGRIRRLAATLAYADWRTRFLQDIPEHVHILQLSDAWTDDASGL